MTAVFLACSVLMWGAARARKGQRMSGNGNEREGNKTAARKYNEAQRRFVGGGKVEKAARDAEQALEGPEQEELREAEALGKSRAAPDPENEDPKVRARAYDIWEREGRPDGRHDDHWRQAQHELAAEDAG
jgi:hypothetical protein